MRGQALTGLGPSCWEEADAELSQSMRLFEAGQAFLQIAHAHVAWSVLCRARGDQAGAEQHAAEARSRFERAGLSI